MSKNFSKLLIVVLLLSMMVLFVGCSNDEQAGTAKEPIKIGFFVPITGPAAADGESSMNAAKLAVAKINEAGGINGQKVVLVDYDDGLDTKQAVSLSLIHI